MKIISTEIQNLEPIKTIAIPHIGEYSGIVYEYEKLFAWAEQNHLWDTSPKYGAVYQDDPKTTPVEKLRSKACIEVLSEIEMQDGMEYYTISGGKYFVMQVELKENDFEQYLEAWKKAYAVFEEKGYEYDQRDHFEFEQHIKGMQQNDEKVSWISNMCIPLK